MRNPGRNDPCCCGSGKKYKHCCQSQETALAAQQRVLVQTAQALLTTAQAAQRAGQAAQAEALCRQLLTQAPDHPQGCNLLGMTLQAQGQLDAAIAQYQLALQHKPAYPEALNNLGYALHLQGKFDAALEHYRQALACRPDLAEVHYNLANTLLTQGRLDDAATHFRQALTCQPTLAPAHYNLGNLLKEQGRFSAAAESYRRVLALQPQHAQAHNNLGIALEACAQWEQAATHYRAAIAAQPGLVEAHCNLGNVLRAQDQSEAAVASYRNALALQPEHAAIHNNLGNALQLQQQPELALAHYQKALAIDPQCAQAHCNLGSLWQSQGKHDQAIASYRRALELKPDYCDAHSNLIFTLDLSTHSTTATLQEERARWDAMHASRWTAAHSTDWPQVNPAKLSDRQQPSSLPLRIGYVSGDFRMHSAASVFGAMLTHFDRARFTVFAYSNTRREDAWTRLFQEQVSGWRNIVAQSDDAVAELIRRDGIDILVDLSGHSAENRLQVFARKPAPLQITAWGYATSTGLRAMDVFFADPVLVPPAERACFTEEVRYLPNAMGYFNIRPLPNVSDLPAGETAGVTFGVFNRLTKISTAAFELWAQVLHALPGSRLVFKTGELDDAAARARIVDLFQHLGIDSARLTLLGKTSWDAHLAAYRDIDIGLDPFPHSGGVTTLESLAMGVPLVTLRWPTVVGRLSASLLTTLELTDWIAESPSQYVALAVRKAHDRAALKQLRATLRARLDTSIIGNPAAYVSAVEQEYRTLWQRWCATQQSRSALPPGKPLPWMELESPCQTNFASTATN